MLAWRRFLLLVALFALVATLAPSVVGAQTRSTVTGTIKDGTGAVLPGVTVTLASPNMVGGAQTTVTTASGAYRFSDLPFGVYEVDATLQGFKGVHRTELQVQSGTTVVVDLTMEVGGMSETVTVSGATPVVDVKSAASTTKLETDLLENLPNAGRSARPNEIMSMAPGVTTNRTAHGGQRDANNIMVDGMSSSIVGGNIRTSVLNYNWTQEVQVVALGANAEYGEFGGTVSNMIMRSGSNAFSGMFDYFTTRQSWLGNNTGSLDPTLQAKFVPAQVKSNYDTTYQVGGPILRDTLFFFAGGEYYHNSSAVSGAQPGPDGQPIPNSEGWQRYIAKFNWAVAKNVKLEGFVEHDKDEINPSGTSTINTATAMGASLFPKTMYNGRLTWTVNAKTLVEVRGGGIDFSSTFAPVPPNTTESPYARKDTVTGLTSGNTVSLGTTKLPRTNVSGSLTKWVDGVAGRSHELKFGAEYERTRTEAQAQYAGGRVYSDQSGKPNQVVQWNGTTSEGTAVRTSFYLQDAWTVNGRLTLQPGFRFSMDRGSIPATKNVYQTNPFDWRIGFAWDVTGDHKTLLRGHAGSFHENITPGMFNYLDGSAFSPKITYRVNADGSFTELNRTAMPSNISIDSKPKQPGMDQYTLALERELLPDFGVTVQYVRRNWSDLLAFVDTASQWAPAQKQDPGPDNVLGTADDGQMIDVYNLLNPGKSQLLFTNPSDATRWYSSFMLIAKKRFSHNWQMLASYTFSHAEGQVGNTGGNTTGTGTEVGQAGQWANPNVKINAYGPGVYDAPHQLVLNGTYRIKYWGGANISTTYRLATGSPWGRTATIRGLAQGNQTVRILTRGTYIAPSQNQWDMRVEKTVPLGRPGRTLGIYVDIFNVLNMGYPAAGGITEASGATYGLPSSWTSARQFQAGVRFQF